MVPLGALLRKSKGYWESTEIEKQHISLLWKCRQYVYDVPTALGTHGFIHTGAVRICQVRKMAIIININVMFTKTQNQHHRVYRAARRHHDGQSLHPENRKSEGDPLLNPGSHLQGVGLPTRRHSGCQEDEEEGSFGYAPI